ncbi:MAG: hypothetical protein V1922_01260 [bacterium]
MQKLKNNILISVGLIVCGLVYFLWIVFQNRTVLFRTYNPVQAEKTYSQSQWQQSQNVAEDKVLDEWAIKNGYTGWKNFEDEIVSKSKIQNQKSKIIKDIQNKGVSDSFLYGYVGYKYTGGTNPSLLNPEHPPLAKYLIGYSIRIFGNEHVVGIGIAFATLLLVALVSYLMYESLLYAGLALFLTSTFPLFSDQIINGPQLELYQLFFFLLLTCFLLLWMKKKKIIFCIVAGLCYGMLLSTKTLLPFLFLFSAWLFISFWKQWKMLLIVFVMGAITFCFTYYSYFLHGGTLHTFLGLQKYIITYYGNAHVPLLEFAGNYLRLIITGMWKFWDRARTVSAYSEWNIIWPLIFFVGMGRLKFRWISHKNTHFLIWFIVLYNLFVFIIPIFPRYLLLLFIPLIILI